MSKKEQDKLPKNVAKQIKFAESVIEAVQSVEKTQEQQNVKEPEIVTITVDMFEPEISLQVDKKELAKAIARLIVATSGRFDSDKFVGQLRNEVTALLTVGLPITNEQQAESIITIVDSFAKLTKTNADDKIVNFLKGLYLILNGSQPAQSFWARIVSRIKERRQNRRNRKNNILD